MTERKRCPYCAEEIRAEAVRCRYCRSHLEVFAIERWHRDHPGRRIAGVATAIAGAFSLPVALVRVGFVALAFVHLLGPALYAALWLLIPARPGADSAFEWLHSALLQGERSRLRW